MSPEFFTSAGPSPFLWTHIPIRCPGCLLPGAGYHEDVAHCYYEECYGLGDVTRPFSHAGMRDGCVEGASFHCRSQHPKGWH